MCGKTINTNRLLYSNQVPLPTQALVYGSFNKFKLKPICEISEHNCFKCVYG